MYKIKDIINKIHCADCLEFMKEMPDKSIDLTITSPPYDNLRDYKGYTFDFEEIAKELFRITKDGGVVVWVVGDATIKGSETGTSFKQALYFKEIGFNLHDTMIWVKKDFIPLTHNRYEQAFEFMFILSKNKPKTFNSIKDISKYGGNLRNKINNNTDLKSAIRNRIGYTKIGKTKIKSNVWIMAVAHTNLKHPAVFPEKLAQDHILSWSNEGDTVLDPMCGSGTTCKMAQNLHRQFIGIEISKEYCKITKQRLMQKPLI